MKNYKEIIKALAPLFIVLLLLFLTAKFSIAKISSLMSQISINERDQNTLIQKTAVLKSISVGVSDTTSAQIALPDQNPVIIVASQLKQISVETGVPILGLKTSAEIKDATGLSSSNISFDLVGDKKSLTQFINLIDKTSPITKVEKVSITKSPDLSQANVTLKAFWSEFPKTLPSLNTNITSLTETEYETLEKITSLKEPSFGVVNPSISGKPDPFN